jgi:hypothetical protein
MAVMGADPGDGGRAGRLLTMLSFGLSTLGPGRGDHPKETRLSQPALQH